MTTGTFTTDLELSINGHSCEREVTIHYHVEPATGDGWDEPRYAAYATLTDVSLHLRSGVTANITGLLPVEVIAALEDDCLLNEEAEREYRKCEAADLARSEVLS